jgi:superfamily II DNA or RNA helicase
MPLRDYQAAGVGELRNAWLRGTRRAAIVWPTGAGKTVGFAHLAKMCNDAGGTWCVIAHRKELIESAAEKIHGVAPHLRVGIVKGRRRELTGVDGVVASVQSLGSPTQRAELRERLGPRLLVIDEAHHAVAPTYRAVIEDLGGMNPFPAPQGLLVAGFTATLARGDRLALGEVWQEVAHRVDIKDLIRRGWLLLPKGRRVKVDGLDLGRVKRTAGDFSETALGEAMHEALAPQAIARAYVEHAADRRGIAFLPTVALAYEMAEAFRAEGITAVAVDGTTPDREREAAIEGSQRGEIQVLCNAMLFTEGTDMPWINCVVLGRPTQSGVLYVQMVGRGLRPYPGQRDCLVLDVVGVGGKHKLASLVDLTGTPPAEGVPDDLLQYMDDLEDGLMLGEPEGAGGGRDHDPGVDGPLVSEEFSLFGESPVVWLRTKRGVWFIDAGDWLVFLTPGGGVGKYTVAKCQRKGGEGGWLQTDLDLSYAMSWGEYAAMDLNPKFGLQRRASWRRRDPSNGQRAECARLGLPVPAAAKQGDVSDTLSVAKASWRLDSLPMLAGVTERGYW